MVSRTQNLSFRSILPLPERGSARRSASSYTCSRRQKLILIESFAYRHPRIVASLPVEFVTEGGVLFGFTRDVSEQGLLADFGEPVLLQTDGRLRFRTGKCVVEFAARVTHTDGFLSGFAFAFSSEQESSFIRSIVHALAQDPDLSAGTIKL